MALRESDGLRAAVMIFFGLVVILAGTTYFFFKSYDEQLNKAAQLQKDVAQANTLARNDRDEINELKRMIGYAPEDTLETVKTAFEADMQIYGATFPEENRFYRPILESMNRELLAVTQREAASVAREEELKNRLAAVEAAKDKQIEAFKKNMDTIAADVAGERNKFNTDRTRVTEESKKLAATLTSIQGEVANVETKSKEKAQEYQKRINTLEQLVQGFQGKVEEQSVKGHEQPAGRITWVNQRANVVWINLGQGDSLRRQINFSVYPVDANDMALPNKKGSIEVTRIIDHHMAECRIVEDDPSNPLLPGDKIHSPVWRPGYRESFALAGFMDVDGDGRSDRDKIRDVIALNGGAVDLELLENGDVQGKMTINTRFLVLGEAPTAAEKNEKVLNNYSSITGEARELGVETISLNRFLSMMGWNPDERTVQLGRGAQSTSFKSTDPHGVRRPSYGSTNSEFQERARPQSTF